MVLENRLPFDQSIHPYAMDGFSVASLSSLCSAISHSAIACAVELAELLPTIPPGQHAQHLASLSGGLQEFGAGVSQFEAAITGASAISPHLQDQLGRSLDACQTRLAPLGKQVMRLQPDNVRGLNVVFVMVHQDLLVAYTQLLGFLNEVLSMQVIPLWSRFINGKAHSSLHPGRKRRTKMLRWMARKAAA